MISIIAPAHAADSLSFGPLFDDFALTLTPGHRTEALGPLFYSEQKETERFWAVPPLVSFARDPGTESSEFDFIYPLLTYDRYGSQYRWQLFQVLSFSGGPTQGESARNRFTIFPLYFQQRSSDPNENYTALLPFYGHVKSRLSRDEVFVVMFPLFSETRKKDVVTDNYLYPFYHRRHGHGLNGWQVWPFVGREHKDVTARTNMFHDVESVAGHDRRFVLGPLFFNETNGIGTDNPQWERGSLPAFHISRSPRRDSTTVLWPFFSSIDDREKKYHEWQLPWPIFVKARGEGKTVTRVFPFFSQAHSDSLQSDFYLWPVYKYNRAHADPMDRTRTRIFFFLYSDLTTKNTQTGAAERRVDFWPFFAYHRDFKGNTRLQVLALVESYITGSHKFDRDDSPVWSIWRSEHNPRAGAASQSLLWNLYRRQTTPTGKTLSVFFGLYQYQQSNAEGKRARLFYIPLGKTTPKGANETSSAHAAPSR